jgi:hypothetical protein
MLLSHDIIRIEIPTSLQSPSISSTSDMEIYGPTQKVQTPLTFTPSQEARKSLESTAVERKLALH